MLVLNIMTENKDEGKKIELTKIEEYPVAELSIEKMKYVEEDPFAKFDENGRIIEEDPFAIYESLNESSKIQLGINEAAEPNKSIKEEQQIMESADERSDLKEKSENYYVGRDVVEQQIIKERGYYSYTQIPSSEKDKFSYADFLLIKMIGKVSYFTKSQALRYLSARKKYYDNDIEFNERIVRKLEEKRWISVTKPIEFKKGNIKGTKVTPYYLTAKGYQILSYIDEEWAQHARFGNPNLKMREHLSHELLITEVYVNLHEKGHFVYCLMQEKELQKEKANKIIKNIVNRSDEILPSGLGDFRLYYFDNLTEKNVNVDGEIAIKYTREKILAKGKNLSWFCLDEQEAEKINLYLNVEPTILNGESIRNFKSRFRLARVGFRKINGNLTDWLNALGGITIETLAVLEGVASITATRAINELDDLKSDYRRVVVSRSRGRGIKLFRFRTMTNENEAKKSFIKCLAIQILASENVRFDLKNDDVSAIDESDKRYKLVSDSDFYDEFLEKSLKVKELSVSYSTLKTKGEGIIICVRDSSNAKMYRRLFPDCRVIDITDFDYSYRKPIKIKIKNN